MLAVELRQHLEIMAKLTILKYPDPRLHRIAKPVTVFDSALKTLVQDMQETMYDAPGIGLAATQVDHHIRLILVDTSKEQNDLMVLINPKIIAKDGEQDYEEGCLSVPGVYETVTRAEHITVEAQDETGETFTMDADGLLSICIQHEMDHLMGKVFVEYLSPLKRNRIKKKMLKHQREIERNSY